MGKRPFGGRTKAGPAKGCVQGTYTEFERSARGNRLAAHLGNRLRNFAHWRALCMLFPGGLVDPGVAARILGVSRQRISQLIKQGSVPLVYALPNSTDDADRLIPVDALLGLPTAVNVGNSQCWRMGKAFQRSLGIGINPWVELLLNTEQSTNLIENSDIPGQKQLFVTSPVRTKT